MRPQPTIRRLNAPIGDRSNPNPENLTRLADAIQKRSGENPALADEFLKAGES